MSDDRRTSDREFERVWRSIEAVTKQVGDVATGLATHTAVCTEHEKARIADRAEMKANIAETNAAVKGLVKAAEERDAAVRFVKRLSGWAGGTATAVGATWAFVEHAWPTLSKIIGRQAVVLLLAGSALAHDDDPVLRDLMSPVTGMSCCHERDCKLYDVWEQEPGGYRIRIDGEWKMVPQEIVIRDRGPHPTGQAVLCVSPIGRWLCFLPGAQGV